MEVVLVTGMVLFMAVVVANMIRVSRLNRSFEQYLKEHHHGRWEQIYVNQRMRKMLLWPFMRDTPLEFGWKSSEDLGDPHISELRRRIRGAFFATFLSMMAVFIWFAIVALVWQYLVRP